MFQSGPLYAISFSTSKQPQAKEKKFFIYTTKTILLKAGTLLKLAFLLSKKFHLKKHF